MKFRILSLIILFLITSCGSTKNQTELAFELCEIYGGDQGVRHLKPFTNRFKVIQKMDSLNFTKSIQFIKKNGYPNKKILGKENYNRECVSSAITAVLLHNPHRLINEKEYLKLLLEEVSKGNLRRQTLATILDKYYWVRRDKFGNRRVLYGTQFGKPCFKYSVKSDSVRKIIGLLPLSNKEFVKCKTIK